MSNVIKQVDSTKAHVVQGLIVLLACSALAAVQPIVAHALLDHLGHLIGAPGPEPLLLAVVHQAALDPAIACTGPRVCVRVNVGVCKGRGGGLRQSNKDTLCVRAGAQCHACVCMCMWLCACAYGERGAKGGPAQPQPPTLTAVTAAAPEGAGPAPHCMHLHQHTTAKISAPRNAAPHPPGCTPEQNLILSRVHLVCSCTLRRMSSAFSTSHCNS